MHSHINSPKATRDTPPRDPSLIPHPAESRRNAIQRQLQNRARHGFTIGEIRRDFDGSWIVQVSCLIELVSVLRSFKSIQVLSTQFVVESRELDKLPARVEKRIETAHAEIQQIQSSLRTFCGSVPSERGINP